MIIELYRHGPTAGNLEYRYVGRTDEEVLPEWLESHLAVKKEAVRERATAMDEEKTDFLIVSPMKRCIQTAGVLFPGKEYQVIESLREKDFGDFEMKNYKDLDGNADYQAWIDGGGMGAFPNGEDTRAFQKRCVEGFEKAIEMVLKELGKGEKAEKASMTDEKATEKKATEPLLRFLVHGGTIMALMDAFSNPHKDYFEWKVLNGECIRCELNEIEWKKGKRELKVI